MKISGVVQARMGSTRLPGKVMMPLAGVPLVGHVFQRLQATRGLCGVVLATTTNPRNDELVAYASDCGIRAFRSVEEDDIASRLVGAVRLSGADAILKVNADCPMVDPSVLGLLVECFLSGNFDYVSNKIRWTWPEGLSAEVIGRAALEDCDQGLSNPVDREFVANLIRDSPDRYRVRSVEGPEDLTALKLSVDTPEDLKDAAMIFDALYPDDRLFGIDAIRAYLEGKNSGET